jgi:glycosyltransferase involved in cell wall biosynthesis
MPIIIEKYILKKIFDIFLGKNILKRSDKLIALTKKEVAQYLMMGINQHKINIIANGIDLNDYKTLPPKNYFKSKYKVKHDEKLILYLGRIHKIKGIKLLLNAFSEIIYKYKNVRLIIAGPDDGDLVNLKKLAIDLKIKNKILFTGPLYGKEKLGAYIDSDIYVLPSIYETFPSTVLESYACGTPSIITNRCGISKMIEKIGLVIDYDKNQLKEAILKLLSDESLKRKLGEKGKKMVLEKYGWQNIIKDIEKIYMKYN